MSVLDYSADIDGSYSPSDKDAQAISCLGYQLQLAENLDEISTVWKGLERETISTSFQYHHYLSSWMTHIGTPNNIRPLVVIGRDVSGQPAFLMPFALRQKGPFKILEWLGAAHANYQSGLYRADFLRELNRVSFKTLWREIAALLPDFDCANLFHQQEMFGENINPFTYLDRSDCADSYFTFSLPENYDDLLAAKRSAKSVKTMKRRDQKLEELGDVQIGVETDRKLVLSALDTILTDKAAQLAELGAANKFPPAVRNWYRDLAVSDNGGAPILQIMTLRLDGRLIAASINTLYGKTMSGLVLYMARNELTKYSPGDRLMRACMEWGCKNGMDTFDLSLGRASYKLRWADEELELFQSLLPQNLLGWVYKIMAGWTTKLKRRVKQSPNLTRILRPIAGSLFH